MGGLPGAWIPCTQQAEAIKSNHTAQRTHILGRIFSAIREKVIEGLRVMLGRTPASLILD
jgi:hypothetical protein